MIQSTTIAIDLAKDVFEIAVSTRPGHIKARKRVSRAGLRKFLANQQSALVLFEACGTCHYWARYAQSLRHRTKIIPAQYVRPYRRRSKTDRADAAALLEAHRCEDIKPVPVRSVEQQQIQQLHRIREQFKKTRTARINLLRGCLRELGVFITVGASKAMTRFAEVLDDESLPQPLRHTYAIALAEIRALDQNIAACERQLTALTRDNQAVTTLTQVQGIGLLTSTATVAAAGSPHHFKSGRHFAAWMGITPREHSSGNRRNLGKISKQGDKYLRTLYIHGARSVLNHAVRRHRAGQTLSRLQQWAVQLHARAGHNKAAVGLANKLARIAWAVWKHQRPFDANFALSHAA